jgi:hypothetical protein
MVQPSVQYYLVIKHEKIKISIIFLFLKVCNWKNHVFLFLFRVFLQKNSPLRKGIGDWDWIPLLEAFFQILQTVYS